MNRDQLTSLMTSWGWSPEIAGAVPYESWVRAGDSAAPSIMIPTDWETPGYDRLMRRAVRVLARAEADRMFQVIVRAKALAVNLGDYQGDGSELEGEYVRGMWAAGERLSDLLSAMNRGA